MAVFMRIVYIQYSLVNKEAKMKRTLLRNDYCFNIILRQRIQENSMESSSISVP